MNKIIKPESINFSELVKNSKTTLSLSEEYKSEMIEILNKEFSEEQQKWYIANLFAYLHFHPTNDYPVNLEHVYKDLGFANKGNAMKTIKSNFSVDEDYKTIIFQTEKNKLNEETRGRKEETVMLNIDTYKSLCMLVKTDKGKEIRKYYVKLENIYNQIIKKEIENKDKLLIEKDKQLELKTIENIKDKESILLKSYDKKSIVYLIFISGILWKFGYTDNIKRRLSEHKREINQDIQLLWCIESNDNLQLENFKLNAFKIKNNYVNCLHNYYG